MKTVRVEPEAKQELAAAAVWYEQRREGLGRELLAEVDARRLAGEGAPPRSGTRRAPRQRAGTTGVSVRGRVHRFGPVIRVIAIAHERRRPGYWHGRLP